jgi:hypothetical protein
VVAGGVAIGGSFGTLEEEAERAGNQTLTLTYTSWHLTQGGSYSNTIYFHAPHFGIPLVATGLLTIVSGLLLVFGRGRLGTLARPAALASAGLLVGTVWTVALVVSADLDAVTRSEDFELTWTTGSGFWLVLAGGIAAVLGGLAALFSGIPHPPADPPTPRYGFPAAGSLPPGQPMPNTPFATGADLQVPHAVPSNPSDPDPASARSNPPAPLAAPDPGSTPASALAAASAPFIPQPAQQVDPLTGHPVEPALSVFQPPTPPTEQPPDR